MSACFIVNIKVFKYFYNINILMMVPKNKSNRQEKH